MIWINASKTKLYRLVAEHIYLPKMKYTEYNELDSTGSFYLNWNTENGTNYRACYLFVNNVPRLLIQRKKKQDRTFTTYSIHELDIEDLVSRGMIRGVRSMRQLRSRLLLQQQEYNYIFGNSEYLTFSQPLPRGVEAV